MPADERNRTIVEWLIANERLRIEADGTLMVKGSGKQWRKGGVKHKKLGYVMIGFRTPMGCARLYAHRIVCGHFHGPPPASNSEVNHKDFNRENNHPENLEWVTPSENRFHAARAGKLSVFKKLTPELVLAMKEMHRAWGVRQYELAEIFGVYQGYVSRIINNKRCQHAV